MEDLADRTKRFAVDVLRCCARLPAKAEFQVVRGQLGRSGSSVGANYRAARRSKSLADFINKLSIVEEESDESAYWLEILGELGLAADAERLRLHQEADQLTAIMVASKKTARTSPRRAVTRS
jgi:four helix bundle protein